MTREERQGLADTMKYYYLGIEPPYRSLEDVHGAYLAGELTLDEFEQNVTLLLQMNDSDRAYQRAVEKHDAVWPKVSLIVWAVLVVLIVLLSAVL